MNKILHLFDEQYVINLLTKEVLPKYPDFCDISNVGIKAHKNGIWDYTYHVVIEFTTTFITQDGKKVVLPIFCSAHSEEPRKNVYNALKFLWAKGFGNGYLTVPHPLFYSDYFRGTFYRGVEGNHLYHYIREKKLEDVENITAKAASWFAKLHNLETKEANNFNKENSRIETIFPGVKHVLWRIKEDYPKYLSAMEKIYDRIIHDENSFLNSTEQRWYVHGDAHPENIIKMGKKKIAVIDFTDLCLSDFTRDIGTFLQQVEYMCNRKIQNTDFSEKIKDIFLQNYFKSSKIKLDNSVQKRIDIYYNYTAIRTANFFLLKDKPEPERAYSLIHDVCDKLEISLN